MITINRITAVIIFIFIGFLLGAFGSLFEYFSLIVFSLFGFIIAIRMKKHLLTLRQHLAFSISISIGIFISGFRILSDAFLIEWPLWLKIVYFFGGALLFFLGYNGREICQKIYDWQEERKWASRIG